MNQLPNIFGHVPEGVDAIFISYNDDDSIRVINFVAINDESVRGIRADSVILLKDFPQSVIKEVIAPLLASSKYLKNKQARKDFEKFISGPINEIIAAAPVMSDLFKNIVPFDVRTKEVDDEADCLEMLKNLCLPDKDYDEHTF